MAAVSFDTLKLAQRLEAAGLPHQQAQDMAGAFSETIGESISREYLDLRLGETRAQIDLRLGDIRGQLELRIEELRAQLELRIEELRAQLELRIEEVRAELGTSIAETKADILRWMFGAVGLQTLAILGGVAALFRLLG